MDKTPVNAHQDEPRTLGGRLPRIVADVLSHDRAFLDALAQHGPRSIEGTVTATQRDSSGANRVQIKRTGQVASEAAWYTVWNPMHVPIVGDVLRLLIVGKGAAVILGAKGGGRPNEHTIAYAGGSHRHYDSGRHLLHEKTDAHHLLHYRADGATLAHHHHETGAHHHIAEHIHSAASVDSTGAPTAPWVRHTANAASGNRYERYHHQNTAAGEMLAHYHDVYSAVAHYLDNGSGTRNPHLHTYSAHTHPKGHVIGDDGVGAAVGSLYHQHAAKGKVWSTDGTQHTWFTNSNANGTQPTLSHIAVGAQGGQLRAQQHNTFGTYHLLGEDASGNLQAQSASASHYIRLSGGASAHLHNANGHVHPSGAYENAPSTDGSVINIFSNAGTGALKRASHSTSPQVVGTGSATITTNNNFAHYQWPSAANGDPHLKVISACVWDPAHTSNPGLYSHTPANAAGTATSYGASVLTSATTSDANHIWGVGALTPDSQVYLWGSSVGGAGSLAVGMAFWAHVIL